MIKLIKSLIDFIKYGNKRNGLIDVTDDKDFGSRAVYTPTKEDLKEALKETFIVFKPKLLDQFDSDFCVGFGGAYEADATEEFDGDSEQGSGAFLYAMSKLISGKPYTSWGTSLLSVCMARVKYGICNKELYDYKRGQRNWFANAKNISNEAHENATKHKAGSAWRLNVPWGMTKFEAIVATLYHYRHQKVLIGTGANAHRITVCGYDKQRNSLVCYDTYGVRSFIKGLRFIDRNEARTLFTPYFVLDIERELAEILVQYNGKVVKTKGHKDCFLIKNGEKHSLVDEKVAWSHGYLLAPNDKDKLVDIITRKELDKIPLGKPLDYEDGKNKWIINRIIEKYKITE